MKTRLLCLSVALLAAGCASTVTEPGASASGEAWQAVTIPGKVPTRYSTAHKDGREAIAAFADRSASMWRRKVHVAAADLGDVSFSWWVPSVLHNASVADIDQEDAAARVLLAFGGDTSTLPARTRMLFDLAEALTGEKPPYATLMYVWDSAAPVGSVIVNPRTDRVRKIVIDSGPANLGQWRNHRRDVAADYRRAFG